MSNQKEYENAMENPFERKRFIQGIDLGETGQYIRKVIIGSNEFRSKGLVMSCNKSLLYNKPRIIIYPGAFSFDFHPNYEDFYSTLVYHEGHHAMEKVSSNYGGLSKCISVYNVEYWAVFDLLEELRASRNQLKHFTSDNSDKFKDSVIRDIRIIERELRDFGYESWINKYGNP